MGTKLLVALAVLAALIALAAYVPAPVSPVPLCLVYDK